MDGGVNLGVAQNISAMPNPEWQILAGHAGLVSVGQQAFAVFIVVIGGIGTIEGPIIGVLVFFVLRNYLAEYGSWYLMLLGALATVVMLVSPQGIWGFLVRKFDLHLFPFRRRLVDGDRETDC